MKTTSTRGAINQAGVGHVVALFLLVFVGVVGFAGYTVMNNGQKNADSTGTIVLQPKFPAKIATTADLTTTSNALDDVETQLDTNLDDSSLDADLDAML